MASFKRASEYRCFSFTYYYRGKAGFGLAERACRVV